MIFTLICRLLHLSLLATGACPAVTFASNGSAHIVDLRIPIPKTISYEAQEMLKARAAAANPSTDPTQKIGVLRAAYADHLAALTEQLLRTYSVTAKKQSLAGVPVTLVTPTNARADLTDRLLINVHGGAFFLGQSSIQEAIPIAARTGITVLAIDYQLAPEAPFPAAVNDIVAVYRELLKTYRPQHLALYGSSAGAIISAEATVRARQLGMPSPAALGFFSGTVDFARPGDSIAMYGLRGLTGHLDPPQHEGHNLEYPGTTDLKDQVLSPIYGDLRGLPPTLFVTSGRDLLLSGTINLHRAYLLAGVDARLIVYDALHHAFWYDSRLPEAIEANHLMADFFVKQLGK